MSKYINIVIGDIAEITHKITQQDIEKFIELSVNYYTFNLL
jgi:hypothetical protein